MFVAAAAVILCPSLLLGEIRVTTARNVGSSQFQFESVPPPAIDDAASTAEFTLIDGRLDRNSGGLAALHDGRVPREEDQPAENFFFRQGQDGGRLKIDLGRVIAIARLGSYSWHTNTRAPQVYTVYGADETATGFDPAPKKGADPASCGWTQIAQVDTRAADGQDAGQHGVVLTDSAGTIGSYRYLLLDIAATETRDPFGNTFYSEFDVVDAQGPAPKVIETIERRAMAISFGTEEDAYRFSIDLTQAPDLAEWSETRLKPVILEWYPKLATLLASDGFSPPQKISLRFRDNMRGVPASAGGGTINLNATWFRREQEGEALGAVVHEMVHVVQSYSRRGEPVPDWLVEGIADYIRWFLYEPEKKGAEITPRNLATARFDASYRISGNFLDWVSRHYDQQLVPALNAAARQGKYSEQLWEERTGKTLPELGTAWKQHHTERLNAAPADGE